MVLGHIERLWGCPPVANDFQDPITQPNASADEIITRDDSVAILATKKPPPKGRPFRLMLIIQHLVLVAGFAVMTFSL
jgi:hypothetical protein